MSFINLEQRKKEYTEFQSEFYDENPPLAPWPEILSKYGLAVLYKPREVFWRKQLDRIGIRNRDRVLDVGCGQGIMLKRMEKTYKIEGIGIDVSPVCINYAKKCFSDSHINYEVGDIKKTLFESESFNLIVSFDVLEHIEAQKKALSEMARVVKPGGKIFIYTLNKNYKFTLDWLWETLGFNIFKRAAHKKDLLVNPIWLKKELEDNGCSIDELKYFDAFFTLAMDEAIMISILFLKKFKLFRSNFMGKIFIHIFNIMSRISYYPLNIMDQFWYSKKISLGFTIIATKQR